MKSRAVAEIERDFPEWIAWRSARGDYWGAVRRRALPDQVPTLIADSEAELREELAAQTGR